MYVPHQKDSYGPDMTWHNKESALEDSFHIHHHQKGPSSKTSIYKKHSWFIRILELLAKPNPGYYDVKSPLVYQSIS